MSGDAEANGSLARFIAAVDSIVEAHTDERIVTQDVAARLTDLLRGGFGPFVLPREFTRPKEHRYVMYPLYVDPRGRFSIASAVWNVGHATAVHSHETWGVVGIYSGIEGETRYVKPESPGHPLVVSVAGLEWGPGQVTVCCTTDDDVHSVECVGDEPCVGIHVYGNDIGMLPRRSYDPTTGAVEWFTSEWEIPG